MGVPWYGYDYPCTDLSGDYCSIKLDPFRGVNCSDAAGTERAFSEIIDMLRNSQNSTRMWDQSTQSPYFNYYSKEDGAIHQVWYDDPASLSTKYELALAAKVRGVGPYRYDQLDYSGSDAHTQAMWNAIRSFKQH